MSKMKNIAANNPKIYELLRTYHLSLKSEILPLYDELTEEQKNALDALHSVLYLVEAEFVYE